MLTSNHRHDTERICGDLSFWRGIKSLVCSSQCIKQYRKQYRKRAEVESKLLRKQHFKEQSLMKSFTEDSTVKPQWRMLSRQCLACYKHKEDTIFSITRKIWCSSSNAASSCFFKDVSSRLSLQNCLFEWMGRGTCREDLFKKWHAAWHKVLREELWQEPFKDASEW